MGPSLTLTRRLDQYKGFLGLVGERHFLSVFGVRRSQPSLPHYPRSVHKAILSHSVSKIGFGECHDHPEVTTIPSDTLLFRGCARVVLFWVNVGCPRSSGVRSVDPPRWPGTAPVLDRTLAGHLDAVADIRWLEKGRRFIVVTPQAGDGTQPFPLPQHPDHVKRTPEKNSSNKLCARNYCFYSNFLSLWSCLRT